MNDIPLDRIEQFQVDKYYIYSKDEDWINKGIENVISWIKDNENNIKKILNV